MAIGISRPVAAYTDNADGTAYTSTGTWTPTVGDVLVGFIQASGTVAAAPTLTGGSLTWTLQASATSNSGANTLYCYTTTVATALLVTPIFTCTADAATGVVMEFLTVTGANTTTPVVQFKTKDSTTGSNPTITFNSNLNTNNGYALAVACAANPPNITAPTSWTRSDDAGHTSPTDGCDTFYRAGGETGATITATRSSINHGIIGIEIAVAAGSPYTMAAGTGSFALTGNATALRASRLLTAVSRAYALTGNVTNLLRGVKLTAGTGAFSLTGNAVNFPKTSRLVGGTGAFSLTGQNAALLRGLRLTAGTGAVSLTGSATNLLRGVRLVAGIGAFTLTGNVITLTYTPVAGAYTLTAGTGSFALTGNAASFVYAATPSTNTADIGPGDYTSIRKEFKLRGEKRPRLKKATIRDIREVAKTEPTQEQVEHLVKTAIPSVIPDEIQTISENILQLIDLQLANIAEDEQREQQAKKLRESVLIEFLARYLQQQQEDEELLMYLI